MNLDDAEEAQGVQNGLITSSLAPFLPVILPLLMAILSYAVMPWFLVFLNLVHMVILVL